MSSLFRLRYFLGLIPTVKKIDSAWTELLGMRDELQQIESSKELTRYNELIQLTRSNEFQSKKREITALTFIDSPEHKLLTEWKNIEHTKSITDYFRFIHTDDFSRLNKIAQSPELVRYFELKKIVESPDFMRRKKEVESVRYKSSPEYQKRFEFNALQNSSRMKRYFATIASDEYQLFLDLDASIKANHNEKPNKKDAKVKIYYKFLKSRAVKNIKTVESLGLLPKYEVLKKATNEKAFIDREAFLKNAARFETTADYAPYNEYTKLSKSSDILFYNQKISSPLNINYQKVSQSSVLARLKELRLIVEESGFKQQVAYLKNKKRYETTPGFKLERELSELEKNTKITTYLQLKKRPELAFFEHWEIVMDENFSNHTLASNLWEPENYWGSKMAGCSFSQPNELQAYNGIKNIQIKNAVLSIITKAEKSEGQEWNPAIGLIPRKFNYSSAIMNTGNSFRFKEGVVEAKVKFRAEKAITSAFSLTGNSPFPQIDVFRSGDKSVGFGIIDQPGLAGIKHLVQIKGLNFNNFHIFRLEVFGNSLVWKINNEEVHRAELTHNPGDLFINFIGSLHQPVNGTLLPHYFEIEWVRCLSKKQKNRS